MKMLLKRKLTKSFKMANVYHHHRTHTQKLYTGTRRILLLKLLLENFHVFCLSIHERIYSICLYNRIFVNKMFLVCCVREKGKILFTKLRWQIFLLFFYCSFNGGSNTKCKTIFSYFYFILKGKKTK